MLYASRLLHALVMLVLARTPLLAAGGQALTRAPGDVDLCLPGTLTLSGSVALANLTALWAQGFRQIYPMVQVAVSNATLFMRSDQVIAQVESGSAAAVKMRLTPSAAYGNYRNFTTIMNAAANMTVAVLGFLLIVYLMRGFG